MYAPAVAANGATSENYGYRRINEIDSVAQLVLLRCDCFLPVAAALRFWAGLCLVLPRPPVGRRFLWQRLLWMPKAAS